MIVKIPAEFEHQSCTREKVMVGESAQKAPLLRVFEAKRTPGYIVLNVIFLALSLL